MAMIDIEKGKYCIGAEKINVLWLSFICVRILIFQF